MLLWQHCGSPEICAPGFTPQPFLKLAFIVNFTDLFSPTMIIYFLKISSQDICLPVFRSYIFYTQTLTLSQTAFPKISFYGKFYGLVFFSNDHTSCKDFILRFQSYIFHTHTCARSLTHAQLFVIVLSTPKDHVLHMSRF